MIAFSFIPSDPKLTGYFAEVSGARAIPGTTLDLGPTLIIGQALGTGYTPNVPVRVSSAARASALYKPGSNLTRTIGAYLKNDPVSDLWALPVADSATAVHAARTIVFGGEATVAGSFALRIGGQKLPITVSVGTTGALVGAAIQAALGADEAAATAKGSTFPVSAADTTGSVVFTARNGGTPGNAIRIDLNYLGESGGERLPAGLTAVAFAAADYLALENGANDPVLTTLSAWMSEKRWGHVVHPWPNTTQLPLFKAELADSAAGRWGPFRRTYGHAYSAKVGIDGALVGTTLYDDQHCSIFGMEGSPTWDCEVAGAFAGACAGSARGLVARPVNTLVLEGVLPPRTKDVWDYTTRTAVMNHGFTVPVGSDTDVRILRGITAYVKNAFGADDPTYLDITTVFNIAWQMINLEAEATIAYPRHILVDNDSPVGPGVPAVTPNAIRNRLIAAYSRWARAGIVENVEAFAAHLVVERNQTDPNRVDILFPPDLANGLHAFTLLNEFRLQYA